ncbi:pyruvate dehydrogenase E2 component (dihydrolipoamide acetyltransferase) [Nocardioides terrae]|uniref:Dihydrolipoamide acetyltransferase component of pyruvate dehydrogenase complex n=1 Tax=Nocardioides terrae TaxID=574651 RepID=A0A1I1F255_9ACTN|nr:dihydrolipoamide acetyltransferase family protein [Nocardioides terrae]SFB91250.1 pyruvate dehydrogenase E2 component (dihydrolipoamide acetyltransferase) [Nocardioides terrae]
MTAPSQDFRLPDVGEGLVEAELVSWQVAVGDTVQVNDIVCEIETAKSVVELPSPYAGIVEALLVEVGTTVEVGTPIIRIGSGAHPSEFVPNAAAAPSAEAAAAAEAAGDSPGTLVGYGPREASTQRRARRTGSARPGQHAAPTGPVLAKPPVRLAAREAGVDLRDVTPTGHRGEVTREDLAAPAAAPAPAAPAAPAARSFDVPPVQYTGRVTREPIKGVRKMMGQAMSASAFTVPHVTIWTTVDVTATTRLVARLKLDPAYAGVRVSPLLVLSRAVTELLRTHPLLNAVWDEAAQEVVLRHYVNLGIAAATPRGLVVPNIKDADLMTPPDLGRAINRLTDVARDGRTQPAEQQGGTFTITNIGPFGMEGGTPIINPGESAILAFGTVQKRPWVVSADGEDRLAVRDVCTLSLSFDHRHVDGASGSAFLAAVAGSLVDPSGLFS